ncbi:tyrosine-type recombinase/integrase [Nocardia sp. BMG111209]|uniref:tyrosine-type recombinase/integrase n=1 Tax=Nocardia sp. BMG111209 TaxID=1160137 RepID=UPI00036B062C|nr:tyrosine-type recombinase/integrase [Nocardia sp. BMG111209]
MGHIEDRWFRPKRNESGDPVLNGRGRPELERTELYGSGLRYRVRYIDPYGRERSKSFPDKQKKRADDFLIEVESDKREGKYIDPRAGRTKFRQQGESWLKAQSPDPASRYVLRRRLENRIYPVFGDMWLGGVGPAELRDWVDDLDARKYSDNYKSVLFDIVAGVLDSAVDDKLIRENPCHAKSVRRPVRRSPKVSIWKHDRLRAVRGGMQKRYEIAVPLGAGLGCRQGEILGFSPELDIDRDGQVAHVQRQVKLVDGELMFALPKRGKTRYAPMASSLLDEIDRYQEDFPAVPVTLPWGSADGELVTVPLLIVHPAGRAFSGDLFSKIAWKPAFAAAGLTYVNRADGMHALRHLFASTLLGRGVSIKELAEYLGHADPGFTLKFYAHLLDDSHERARLALDAVWKDWAVPPDGLAAA